MADVSGRTTLRNAILDFQFVALEFHAENPILRSFQLTGPVIPCGTTAPGLDYVSHHFPYSATENRQKTIGAHFIFSV